MLLVLLHYSQVSSKSEKWCVLSISVWFLKMLNSVQKPEIII